MMEAVEVLNRYVNQTDYEMSKQKLLMKYGSKYTEESEKAFIEKMDILQGIFQRVIKNINLDSKLAKFFFKKYYFKDMNANIAYIIMMNFGDITISDIRAYGEDCKKRWKKIMNSKVTISGISWSGLLFEKNGEVPLQESLSEEINKLPCPLELKWEIQMLLSRMDYYIDQLTDMAVVIENELREELKVLDPILEPLYPLWEEIFQKSWMEDMKRRLDLENKKISHEKVKLCLLRMPCDLVNIDELWDESDHLHVSVGITVETDDNSDGSQVRVEMISEKLKILSEPNRFKILTMLTRSSFYGQEIAIQLGLDASTTSRHLTALLKHNLIYIDGSEGRNTYYRTNEEEMRNLILLLNKIFLQE